MYSIRSFCHKDKLICVTIHLPASFFFHWDSQKSQVTGFFSKNSNINLSFPFARRDFKWPRDNCKNASFFSFFLMESFLHACQCGTSLVPGWLAVSACSLQQSANSWVNIATSCREAAAKRYQAPPGPEWPHKSAVLSQLSMNNTGQCIC